jgi:hypothetical protein
VSTKFDFDFVTTATPDQVIDEIDPRCSSDMTDPIARIRKVLDDHRVDDAGVGCICGATRLSDHARHVAEEIVAQLGLQRENVGNEMRYVSAWFDDELTPGP